MSSAACNNLSTFRSLCSRPPYIIAFHLFLAVAHILCSIDLKEKISKTIFKMQVGVLIFNKLSI